MAYKTDPKFALEIIQRMIDKWYIDDPYSDSWYENWYASCLKDIAFLILWDDEKFWFNNKD